MIEIFYLQKRLRCLHLKAPSESGDDLALKLGHTPYRRTFAASRVLKNDSVDGMSARSRQSFETLVPGTAP